MGQVTASRLAIKEVTAPNRTDGQVQGRLKATVAVSSAVHDLPVSRDLDPVQHAQYHGDGLVGGVRVGRGALKVFWVREGGVGNVLLQTHKSGQKQGST